MHAKQALTTGCLAAILITIGTLSPGWTIISGSIWDLSGGARPSNESVKSIRLGLWYQQTCTPEKCITSAYPSEMYDVGASILSGLTEFRILTTAGILLSITACGLVFLHLRETKQKLTGVAASMMFLFAGIITWLPSGKMIHRYVLFDAYFHDLGISGNPLTFPYSTIICGVGGILECFSAFLVAYNVWKIWNYSAEFKHKRMELNTYI